MAAAIVTKRLLSIAKAGALAAALGFGAWLLLADMSGVHVYTGGAPPATAASRPARIALVLGGGGPRGFAHVGVLKVLERHHVRPDIIVGSSMGALIGALYSAHPDARELERMVVDADLQGSWRDLTLVRRPWFKGDQLERLLRSRLGDRPLQSLAIPTIAVATDAGSGEPVAFSVGDAVTAVRASTAVPGTFKRVGIGGREYFDGDVTAPVPVSLARAAGARFIIAVDVMCHPSEMQEVMRDYPDLIISDYFRHAINLRELPVADAVISPRLGFYAGFSRAERIRFIAAGEAAAEAAMPALKRQLEGLPP